MRIGWVISLLLSFRRKERVVRISVSIPSSVLKDFDKIIRGEFKSRSEAITYLIRLYVDCKKHNLTEHFRKI